MSFIRRLFGWGSDRYKLEALVSHRFIESAIMERFATHVICDLDKTFIETEFESWVKMAKIPFERPHQKITVPGASEVLQLARWGRPTLKDDAGRVCPEVGLHFVSSSPPQLRNALDGKLTLDLLDWSSDTFKNQTYNLRMARIDLLKHHIAYKTRAILDVLQVCAPSSKIWMIGDNAEYDPFIYVGVKLFLQKSLSITGFRDWLAKAHVESNVIDQVLKGVDDLPARCLKVEGVLIRKLPQYPVIQEPLLARQVCYFDSWLQVGWLWLVRGVIDVSQLWPMIRDFHNYHGLPLSLAKATLQGALEDSSIRFTVDLESEVKRVINKINQIDKSSSMSENKLTFMYPLDADETFLEADVLRSGRLWYQSIVDARKHH